MNFKKIVKMFKDDNVCVTGLRGTGKDMLMSNVIARRNEAYISNVDYGGKHAPLDFNALDMGGNSYKDFINGTLKKYEFPYSMESDIYLSDAGVYFPSQYCNELNRDYKHLPAFMALSRQLAHSNFHTNCQNLNRCWDKLREMSGTYIRCRKCIYIPKIDWVIQLITIYDKYQSCVDRVQPCRITSPLFNRDSKTNVDIYRDNFFNTHGTVKNRILIYKNKSSYDTYYFEKLLKEGI